MTKRRDFIRKSAIGSASIAIAGLGCSHERKIADEDSGPVINVSGKEHLSLKEVKKKIDQALGSVKVIDPHCHLSSGHPGARNLADIVLYHHVWIELVSAGMGQYEVTKAGLPHELADPGMDPVERVRKALPYLNRIRNTTIGMLLRWLLKDIYGTDSLNESSVIEKLASDVENRGKDEAWTEKLFSEICRIEKAFTVEPLQEKCFHRLAGADERFRILNIADGKLNPRECLQSMSKVLGRDIRNAADYHEFSSKLATSPSFGSPLFITAWMPAFLTDELTGEKEINRIIAKAIEGKPLTKPEMGSVSYFGLASAIESLRKTPVRTIQFIVGAEVLLPHRSVTQWDGSLSGAAARLASKFGDFRFNMSAASDIFTHDIAVMAKHIPNVSVGGYWWHTFYPFYIKKSIETRLDLVPASKIIAFFSDAYHSEWCWPKLRLVKQITGEILIDRISRGMYDLDTALSLIPVIFYDAPKEIYGFRESGMS
jgi:hypothetical protein